MGLFGTLPFINGGKGARSKREEVAKALKEWQDAVRYFESVKDPELVDFAIYGMEAARRKYMFLLKKVGAAK